MKNELKFTDIMIKDMESRVDALSEMQEHTEKELKTLERKEYYARGLNQGYLNCHTSEIEYLQEKIKYLRSI
ncbi:hypothetical protein RW25_05335 [Bacillus sp. L_1B0_8]|uniref:hypothetical protein n=1 Tax=unclassified Bacillus (in: firmicutes) TaxID=185979 RepID=UPI0005B74264|nr:MULTISPECIES: hypothetical protein [unclassified Bacillus (in: firmicutes)]KIQ83575.1 hypothetical protein RT27_22490 [Bacillus sp. L_1B0_5]KIQ91666.1 hypothetical protein RW25_05335 [Bacillus sp. L_1B0_8]